VTFSRFVIFALALASMTGAFQSPDGIESLRKHFVKPPNDSKIMMRWWWFGAAVSHPEVERELRVMKDAGIGGVEIQPVYPLALDDAQTGIKNLPYLSPEFLEAVHFASTTARAMGMRVDITIGSGWPFGGPHTPVTQAAGRLRFQNVIVPEGAHSVPVPAIENGEKLIAAFIGGQPVQMPQNGRIEIPPGLSGSDLLWVFISSRTGQQVKRPAIGAEGFVLDPYSHEAIENHLESVGGPLLQAFGDAPPYAVFSDSLEVFGSDWTNNFLEEFRKRRGYDLTPYLPALVNDMGPNTRAIRHDWGKTLTELANEDYLTPIREWAHAHHTLFRSQTYGEPPVTLSSNALVDLPEGEHGPSWRRFSAARWASSACHLYGKQITSTETWTWLHSPSFRAAPLDMKAEADRHFVEGINQLIGHGWPYSPPSAGEPGWRFYAAAAFNDHNPWFQVMPDIAKYLQRVSFLMRQGRPANDIAIYVPTDDAWARLKPGKVALDETVDALLGPMLVPAVLNAGYNFDFIDDPAIDRVGIPYKLVILPGIERIPLATMQHLQQYVRNGGLLIATRSLPSLGPGLLEETRDTPHIHAIAHELFETGLKNTRYVREEQNLSNALQQMLPPDFSTGNASPAIGFMHRKLPFAEIYFAANMSNQPVDTEASVRATGLQPEYWDPFSGETEGIAYKADGGRTNIELKLAPYESRVLVFTHLEGSKPEPQTRPKSNVAPIDISSDWDVRFPPLGRTVHMAHLHSWTANEETLFYSGHAIYEKTVNVPASFFASKGKIVLDFGPGTPVEPGLNETTGMRALLESPVHESAVVFVNGKRAGTIWRPPYELDVTSYLREGANLFRFIVGNLAINEMAGRALPDYHLLNMRYGDRFVPQGMQDVKPLPSGIVGSIHLVSR
jgi:hypothetical protein